MLTSRLFISDYGYSWRDRLNFDRNFSFLQGNIDGNFAVFRGFSNLSCCDISYIIEMFARLRGHVVLIYVHCREL